MIFARNMPEFYIKIARKFFSWILGGHVPPSPFSPAPQCQIKTLEALVHSEKWGPLKSS